MYCKNCGTNLNQEKAFCSNCGTNNNINSIKTKKKKKHTFIKLLFILILIFLMFKGINSYRKSLDKIYITNSQIYDKKDNQNFYKITDKIEKINLKIKTWKKVKKATIKLSSYNLVLFEEEYTKNKKWKIEEISLPIGISYLEIKVILDNENVIERTILIYNSSEENLGDLDTEDADNDRLLNYEEEIYGTNKGLKDTDNDGLTDYEEIMYTKTMPTKYSTYNENISDANDDYDNDGLSNLEELQLETNPIIYDTDGDGLTDYEEIKVYNTEPKKTDTDEDSVTDYDEVKNFSTNPLTKTEQFSGKVESENREIGITLNNVSIEDIKNTKFEYTGISALNENMAGYIMPAYDISTDVSFMSSNITFNFENYEISADAIPTIYYYNESTGFLEELPTTIFGKTATATVTHFSTYILIDKNLYEQINKIDLNSSQIELTKQIGGEYIFFVSPIAAKFINVPFQILTSPEVTDEQAEQIKEEIRLSLELDYEVEIKIIKSTIGFNFMKTFYNSIYEILYKFMLALDLGDLFTTVNVSDSSYYHSIADTVLIGYVQNTNDLGKFLSGDNNIFEDDKILINLEDEKDSNNDGISDNYTLAILNGNIKTATGINPFENYTIEQIQKNDDLDKDGIKNGDEIKISKNEKGKLYLEMKSDPSLKDSDYDGINDKEDDKPLESNFPGFMVGGKLSDSIDVSNLEKEVNEYNSLFGTGEFDYKDGKIFSVKYQENGVIKYSPNGGTNLIGEAGAITLERIGLPLANTLFDTGDAKKALNRYYSKDASVYTEKDLVEPSLLENGEINSQSIFGSGDTQSYLKINLKKIMDISEETIKHKENKVIKTTKYLIGTSQSNGFYQNENVWGFLHSSSAQAIAEISNNNDKYKMKLRYFILDIYDWKNSEECDINTTFCKIEVDYFNDMLLGNAKAFLVKIEYDIEITWKKGGEPTIKLLDGTPYSK